jgi:hypothetical protein
MESTMKITRKEFLGRLITGAAGVAGVAMVVGCGSSSSSSADAHAVSCTMNGTQTTIGTNHGHVMMVSKDDVNAGVDRPYDIRGTASHTHTVMVTAQMFTTLQSNTSVTATTVPDATGHSHMVTVMCA